MSFTEYETAVIQKLKECVQFKHWTFDDLKESIYDDFEYCDDLKQFYRKLSRKIPCLSMVIWIDTKKQNFKNKIYKYNIDMVYKVTIVYYIWKEKLHYLAC